MTAEDEEHAEPVFGSLATLLAEGPSARWTLDRDAHEVVDRLGAPHATAQNIEQQAIVTTPAWVLCPGATMTTACVSEVVFAVALFIYDRFPMSSTGEGVISAFRIAGFDFEERPDNYVRSDDGSFWWPDWSGLSVRFHPERWRIVVQRPRPPGGGREPDFEEILRAA